MYNSLYIDIATGDIASTAGDADVYQPLQMYLRDVLPISLQFLSNGSPVTSTVLANNSILRLGIKTASMTSTLLAASSTYTLSTDGTAALVTLNLNTTDLVNYFTSNVSPTARQASFWFEVEVSASDESTRQTYCQTKVTIIKDINAPTDLPPTPATTDTHVLKGALFDSHGNAFCPNFLNFRSDITGPSGGGTNLDAVPTASATKPMVFITFYGNQLRPWILTASSGTPVTGTGIVVPLDWNSLTNNVQWTELAFS